MSCLCLMPFSSLHIAPDGSFRLCSSNNNIVLKSNSVSIREAWEDFSYAQVREAMLNGSKPQACEGACYSQEVKGLKSKREKFNTAKAQTFSSGAIELDSKKPTIRYLDIAFSNTCNLKCTMCTSHYSTSWLKHDQQAVAEGLNFRRATPPSSPLSEERIEELLQMTPQLFAVWIKGGEPLVDERCLSYLKRLSKTPHRYKDLHVFLQTNGTRWNEQIRDAIQGLSPEIGISIDGTGLIYEWIRGFSFEKMDRNIRAFANEDAVKKVVLQFTLSAYNLFNVKEMIQYFLSLKEQHQKIETLCFGGIVRQEWGNVHAVPRHIRQQVAEEIRPYGESNTEAFENLDGLLKVLDADEVREEYFYNTGQQWIAFCDRMRGQKLSQIEPRFLEIFKEPPRTWDCIQA